MPPLASRGGREWAVAQHAIDPEKHVHVPDVYGVWTAKPWIVKQAAELNPYDSEYFFWVRPSRLRSLRRLVLTSGALFLSNSRSMQAVSETPASLTRSRAFPLSWTTSTSASRKTRSSSRQRRCHSRLGRITSRRRRLAALWIARTDCRVGGMEGKRVRWIGGIGRRGRLRRCKLACRGEPSPLFFFFLDLFGTDSLLGFFLFRFSAKEQPIWTQAARLNWQKIYVQVRPPFRPSFLASFPIS